jgi:hypothetical protein
MKVTTNIDMNNMKIYKIVFGDVYPAYIQKAEKKGRTKEEVDEVICWLTGYDKKALQKHIEKRSDLKTFICKHPKFTQMHLK